MSRVLLRLFCASLCLTLWGAPVASTHANKLKKFGNKLKKKTKTKWKKLKKKVKAYANKCGQLPKHKAGLFRRFAYKSRRFKWVNAYLTMLTTSLAYCEPNIIKKAARSMGLRLKAYYSKSSTELAILKHRKFVIVAFRGTNFKHFNDIITDLKALQVGLFGARAHKGFSDGIKAVWPRLYARVKRLSKKGKLPVFLTGHSLGGALAVMAGVRFGKARFPIHGIYTFGQPRVGDKKLLRNVKAPLYRIVNEGDLVPAIPASISKKNRYSNTGRMIFFTRKGRYKRSQRAIPRYNFKRILRVGMDLKYHSLTYYSARLHAKLPKKYRKTWPKAF